mmetsp:Transcript_13332/g.15288  ORF Transcript_13332/g.15288 Transcript_13332/m.15288 type:complete len:101 (+) Transcript_13332:115-417(+)
MMTSTNDDDDNGMVIISKNNNNNNNKDTNRCNTDTMRKRNTTNEHNYRGFSTSIRDEFLDEDVRLNDACLLVCCHWSIAPPSIHSYVQIIDVCTIVLLIP